MVLIGFVFFNKYTLAGIENSRLKYDNFKFRQMISTLPSLAELKCSELGVERECIDVAKIGGFYKNSDIYFNEFGYKEITVKEVFLEEKTWEIYSKELNNYQSELIVSSPVSLYYPDKKLYGIGVLEIKWYR
jgi:hypothetical protein